MTARSSLQARREGPPARSPRALRTPVIRVLPGEFHVTGTPGETLVTVLGSCVAACIRDPVTGFGGLNHFMLPEGGPGDWCGNGAAYRYGNYAMEALINAVLKSGCTRQNLEVKLFGGANMYGSHGGVGEMNAAFALRYLEAEGIPVAGQDLGGDHGRRIHYVPTTGKVQRLMLKSREELSVCDEETRYARKLRGTPIAGTIDLFE